MSDTYPIRPVTGEEFETWARVVSDTYGEDRTEEDLAVERSATELERTLAAFDEGRIIGGTAACTRVLTVPGAVLPTAGITWVGVTPTHRRRGVLTCLMRRQLTDLYEGGGEPIAALRPSEAPIYGRYGYGPASRGALLRCEKRSMAFLPGTDFGDGRIRLLERDEARPLVEEVYERVRPGAVGWPDRPGNCWDIRLADGPQDREGATALRHAVHRESGGRADGYALYRIKDGHGDGGRAVQVVELVAVTRRAYAALWRFLAGIDLVPWIEYEGAADEALPYLLADPRAVRAHEVDRLWVRLVDVARALAGRRYALPLEVVLDVRDDFCPWNTGRLRLWAETGTAGCERTAAAPDLRLTPAELGAAFLGGTTLETLARAGRVEELRPGALARASAAFRGAGEPFYPGGPAFPAF
ncbi:GNAT family N-acetyltransferase [Streptosporangium sp. NPDC049376]|uniref:GNAT family N-acetyltransferase n=1 Tax=Streptosporangium sp. NPDC049376 TaxID=3366192 RepID=UPI0037935B06